MATLVTVHDFHCTVCGILGLNGAWFCDGRVMLNLDECVGCEGTVKFLRSSLEGKVQRPRPTGLVSGKWRPFTPPVATMTGPNGVEWSIVEPNSGWVYNSHWLHFLMRAFPAKRFTCNLVGSMGMFLVTNTSGKMSALLMAARRDRLGPF